jgi:hypothetical protein
LKELTNTSKVQTRNEKRKLWKRETKKKKRGVGGATAAAATAAKGGQRVGSFFANAGKR